MGERRVLERFVVAGYAAIGAGAAVLPAAVPAVFGGSAGTPEARTEVRAVYAGIPLAFAVSILRATPGERRGVLAAVRDASAGMALARLCGAAVERRLPLWPTGAFVALEAALAAAAHRADDDAGNTRRRPGR
ncbi:DUF4345 family protein [Blastococcus haudaquaticus]|uniref:DUF4345 domain-containing protein n=1 Tax=Blastococcus haudaquaticus TaxID=1938745 RepID=A0A286H549_9ACTN|nr:DUF4345 family protein [Blastococcus haudaquaticus]SOE02918.1 protein of unknown function [Blastococcus haudaquaticus]